MHLLVSQHSEHGLDHAHYHVVIVQQHKHCLLFCPRHWCRYSVVFLSLAAVVVRTAVVMHFLHLAHRPEELLLLLSHDDQQLHDDNHSRNSCTTCQPNIQPTPPLLYSRQDARHHPHGPAGVVRVRGGHKVGRHVGLNVEVGRGAKGSGGDSGQHRSLHHAHHGKAKPLPATDENRRKTKNGKREKECT